MFCLVRIILTKPTETTTPEKTMKAVKQITLDGVSYKVRYAYTTEDGTEWLVLDVDGGFFGKYGDEVPASVLI
jgi:hypothetical protein